MNNPQFSTKRKLGKIKGRCGKKYYAQTIEADKIVTVPAAYAKDGTLIRKEHTFKKKVYKTIIHERIKD